MSVQDGRPPMARELTIQIRLSEEEHATIASQAKREGIGVGRRFPSRSPTPGALEGTRPRQALREGHRRRNQGGTLGPAPPVRTVLDTNVLVSALLSPEGAH